ncbi:hypothetical protein GCM10027411_08860 [Microbacterium aureliae]
MLVLTLAPPAQAAPPEGVPAGSPLDQCVSAATAAKHQQWTCLGGELTIEKDSNGKAVGRTERIAAELPAQANVPGASAQKPMFSTASFTTKTATVAAASSIRVVPMKGGDFYDTWCETGTICSRSISTYASETKGNAAYGNQSGVIGSYDVIITTNLNGRQGQWVVRTIWDSGPGLNFNSPTLHCRQKDFWAALDCGNHGYYSHRLTSSNYRYTSNTLYGNKLVNIADYYGQFKVQFTPDGYPPYNATALNTRVFHCPSGGSRCFFP